jgi:hypothetical protein
LTKWAQFNMIRALFTSVSALKRALVTTDAVRKQRRNRKRKEAGRGEGVYNVNFS